MVSLEQVKLLEAKVIKTVEYVKKITEENTLLKGKLSSNQQRIDELEALIRQFKEDQSRIEDGILSALDRLNQFEDALEIKYKEENTNSSVNQPMEAQSALNASATTPATDNFISNPVDSDSIAPKVPDDEQPKPKNADNELDIF